MSGCESHALPSQKLSSIHDAVSIIALYKASDRGHLGRTSGLICVGDVKLRQVTCAIQEARFDVRDLAVGVEISPNDFSLTSSRVVSLEVLNAKFCPILFAFGGFTVIAVVGEHEISQGVVISACAGRLILDVL